MTSRDVTRSLIPLIALAAISLQGCIVAAVGAAGTVGAAAVQERSMGDAVDDTVIKSKINSALLQKSVDLFGDVEIDVVEGRVMLTGSVPVPEDRVEAVRLTWTVDGIKEIINEIQVEDESGLNDYAQDSWITARIKSKLLFEKEVRSINYNIETVNAVVYMIGIAQSQGELERVTNIVRNVPNVRRVVSHVRVRSAG
jgi:osmotically-inducible protein OsmY